MLDAGRRQLVEHLGMLRPHAVEHLGMLRHHAVVAPQQRVRALVVKFARAQEADEKRGVQKALFVTKPVCVRTCDTRHFASCDDALEIAATINECASENLSTPAHRSTLHQRKVQRKRLR